MECFQHLQKPLCECCFWFNKNMYKIMQKMKEKDQLEEPKTNYIRCLVSQMVRNLPAMQETQIWSLGQKDSLEKDTATHVSILAWRIPWSKEPGGLQFMEVKAVRCYWVTNTFTNYMLVAQLCPDSSIMDCRPQVSISLILQGKILGG